MTDISDEEMMARGWKIVDDYMTTEGRVVAWQGASATVIGMGDAWILYPRLGEARPFKSLADAVRAAEQGGSK